MSTPAHKTNFVNALASTLHVSGSAAHTVDASFAHFWSELLAQMPDEGRPADGYLYNSHMGECLRAMSHARDSFIHAQHAFANSR